MKRTYFPGLRFGRLVLLDEIYKRPYRWVCACDCGALKVVQREDLGAGRTRSCGCLNLERIIQRNTTHGLTGTAEYNAWQNMKRRCSDPSHKHFKDYGGRGIGVCSRWKKSFRAFLSDVGQKPSATHELDRIDVNGNYEPKNVRWVIRQVSRDNKRGTIRLSILGAHLTMSQWAKVLGIDYATLRQRRKYGWPDARILTTEVDVKRRRGDL